MDTFLAPIERPDSLVMRLVYYFTEKQFGKVLTPLKVFGARMPLAFGKWQGQIAQLDKKLTLPAEAIMLVREQVAHLNVCLFCIDIGRSMVIRGALDEAKFDALAEYITSPLFSDRDRAILDYVTALTRDKKVDTATFDRLGQYCTEREICEIVYLVASEHVYNMTNIGLNIHSDMLCDITRRR